MQVDLLAGTAHRPLPGTRSIPTILVFDSGLGGLSVLARLSELMPNADIVYAADDAGFPYGRLDETRLVARVRAVMERLVAKHLPDLVVIACNTASTLVLAIPVLALNGLPVGYPATSWAAIAALALLSSALAYVIYFRILATAGATNISLVTFLVPVSAILLGWAFLDERLGAAQLLGMALIGGGLALIDGRLLAWRRAMA